MEFFLPIIAIINKVVPTLLWKSKIDHDKYSVLSSNKIHLGVYDPFDSFADQSLVTIEHYFVTWRLDNAQELVSALNDAKKANRLPLITLEPWPWQWNNMVSDTLFDDILAGKYDPTIERIFQVIKKHYNQPILLRFAHEMDIINLYPWSIKDGKKYIKAYQYIVDFARRLEVNNLIWVWSPAGNINALDYYPGDNYVDYVGISIFAYTKFPERNMYQDAPSLEQIISEKYWLANFAGKPMILAEVGISAYEEEKTKWLQQVGQTIIKFPKIKAFVYFNQEQPYHISPTVFEGKWQLSDVEVNTLLNSWSSLTSLP